jgi:hypothetical protein
MITVQPVRSVSRCAISRAKMSLPPPAAKPTIIRITLLG